MEMQKNGAFVFIILHKMPIQSVLPKVPFLHFHCFPFGPKRCIQCSIGKRPTPPMLMRESEEKKPFGFGLAQNAWIYITLNFQ
jgi:hypothetical protein